MPIQTGQCPKCHQINSYSKANCLECGARLPWADVVEAAQRQIEESAEKARQAQAAADKAKADLRQKKQQQIKSTVDTLLLKPDPSAQQQNPTPSQTKPSQLFQAGDIAGYDKRQVLSAIGSVVMAIGVFMPLVTVPLLGSINYFSGDGKFLLVLAIISFALSAKAYYRLLALSGGISLLLLIMLYINFQRGMSELSSKNSDNPFAAGMAEAMGSAVQISYGYPAMLVGAGLIIFTAILDYKIKQNSVVVESEPEGESIT